MWSIICDAGRESPAAFLFDTKEYKVIKRQLTTGDYAIANENGDIIYIIERKTWTDLADTIKNERRMANHHKLIELRDECGANIIYLIETSGKFPLTEKVSGLLPQCLMGFLETVQLGDLCTVLYSTTIENSAQIVSGLVRRGKTLAKKNKLGEFIVKRRIHTGGKNNSLEEKTELPQAQITLPLPLLLQSSPLLPSPSPVQLLQALPEIFDNHDAVAATDKDSNNSCRRDTRSICDYTITRYNSSESNTNNVHNTVMETNVIPTDNCISTSGAISPTMIETNSEVKIDNQEDKTILVTTINRLTKANGKLSQTNDAIRRSALLSLNGFTTTNLQVLFHYPIRTILLNQIPQHDLQKMVYPESNRPFSKTTICRLNSHNRDDIPAFLAAVPFINSNTAKYVFDTFVPFDKIFEASVETLAAIQKSSTKTIGIVAAQKLHQLLHS